MKNDIVTYPLSFEFFVETLIVILSGGMAWWLFRMVSKWVAPKLPQDLPTAPKTVALRMFTAIVIPLGWIGILFLISQAMRKVLHPWGLVDGVLPALWFLLLYQVFSVSVTLLLPKRRFTYAMIRFALAIGILTLALRFSGWYENAMTIVNYPLLSLGPTSLSLAVILKAIFGFWVLLVTAGQITNFLQNRVLSKTDMDPSLSFAMMRFLKFFLFGIGALIVLDTMGVNLSTLTIFGGALGIGLGFGLQNIASNLVSGMILLLDRSIKQGDVITVGESYGWVVKLGARYIVVRTRDGVEKLIPNANLIASDITNWSHSDRTVRLHIKVGAAYHSDPFRVRELLLQVANTNPRILKFPKPNVLFVDFGESSLDFELRVWINDPQEGIESVRSATRFEIWKIFKEHGIEIPFPQRDLHIKSGLEALPLQDVRSEGYDKSLPPSDSS